MKFTDEQNNALDSQGKVLVSAAAGSGKTAVLVERIISMVVDEENPVDIDSVPGPHDQLRQGNSE